MGDLVLSGSYELMRNVDDDDLLGLVEKCLRYTMKCPRHELVL